MSVGIIATVRDGTPYLSDMLDSVRNQSYGDWEMVIIDDNSIDDTRMILAAYAELDARISWKPSSKPGRGHALNQALSEVHGDLVANIDADDLWTRRRLSAGVEALRIHENLALVGAGFYLFDKNEEAASILRDETPLFDTGILTDVTMECLYRNPINHSSVLIRRSALQKVGGYDAFRHSQFDYDLWARLVIAGEQLGRLQERTVLKRVHPAQSFEQREHRAYVRSSLEIQRRCIAHFGGGLRPRTAVWCRRLWGEVPRPARLWIRQVLKGH